MLAATANSSLHVNDCDLNSKGSVSECVRKRQSAQILLYVFHREDNELICTGFYSEHIWSAVSIQPVQMDKAVC